MPALSLMWCALLGLDRRLGSDFERPGHADRFEVEVNTGVKLRKLLGFALST